MTRILTILFFLFSFNLIAQTQIVDSQKIYKVGILKDWKPYYITNKNQKSTGYAIELFETIASNINLKYKYVPVNS